MSNTETAQFSFEDKAPDLAPDFAPNPAQLQVVDIENAVRVIDYASEQGAFKGWGTINEVMAIRNRLVMFLKSVTPVTVVETAPEGLPEVEGAQ